MKKPNYNMERNDRERAKQAKAKAKATAKVDNRAVKRDESRQSDASQMDERVQPGETERQKLDD